MAGAAGFEPTTLGFGDRCSTTELYPFEHTNTVIKPILAIDTHFSLINQVFFYFIYPYFKLHKLPCN